MQIIRKCSYSNELESTKLIYDKTWPNYLVNEEVEDRDEYFETL